MSETEKDKEIAELRSQLAEMKATVITLQRQVNPPPAPPKPAVLEGHSPSTYRLLDQMSVPKEILRQMQRAVPDEVVREIAKDGKR